MKIEAVGMSVLQAAALREERHAAQQRREAAMHAQGGYSLDAIQPVLKPTQLDVLISFKWFHGISLVQPSQTHALEYYLNFKHIMFFAFGFFSCFPVFFLGSRHVDFQPIPSPGLRRRSAEVRCEMSFAVRRAYACPICSESFAKWSICQNHVNSIASWHS